MKREALATERPKPATSLRSFSIDSLPDRDDPVASRQAWSFQAHLHSSNPFQSSTTLLEQSLGVTLLRRTTRKVNVTDEGVKALAWAQRLLDDIEVMREDLARGAGDPQGPVRICSSARLGREVVAPALSLPKRRYPAMDVRLELLDRQVDLIGEAFHLDVRAGDVEEPNLIGHLVARNSRMLCAAPSYLEQHGTPETLADVAACQCVLLRERQDPFGTWLLTGPTGTETVKARGALASNDIDGVLRWACDGHRIVTGSQWLLAPSLASGRLVRRLPQWEPSAKSSPSRRRDRRSRPSSGCASRR